MSGAARKKLAGVVVSAGKMMKTVKVRMVKQEWNRHLRKVRTKSTIDFPAFKFQINAHNFM